MNVLLILFYIDDSIDYNIEPLKFGYIFKKYYLLTTNELNIIFTIYNKIIEFYNLNNIIDSNNYIYEMFDNKYLKEYEYNCYLTIPKIKLKFNNNIDIIDIIDFQDSFTLMYEIIYTNKFVFNSKEDVIEICNELLNSTLSNIRSNKFIKIDKNDYNSDKEIEVEIDNNFIFNLYDELNVLDSKLNDLLDDNKKNNSSKKYKLNNDEKEFYSKLKEDTYKLKYDQYKNQYLKLKKFYKLLEFNYFNINLIVDINEFINNDENIELLDFLSNENDIDKILNFYKIEYLINDEDDNDSVI